ncbi:MAG: HD domain-containing protein [Candidatus Nitrosocosmicus sp.]|nr:HD domain-containing protein [Candidatus Nitrosocosmicus sp.]
MKETIIRDPVHGYIDLSHYPFISELIENPYFQRLRRLSQLGVSVFVYPSAIHNRFSHSLGAMQLFVRIFDHLFKDIEQTEMSRYAHLRKIGVATIMLHDIGHGPFSHVSETIFNFKHHVYSQDIISNELRDILSKYDIDTKEIASVINKSEEKNDDIKLLSQLIDSTIDVDRLDYLTRDIYFTGVGFCVIDFERIIRTMQIYNGPSTKLNGLVVIQEKGKRSIETFLLTRDIMYSDIYHHKTTRGIEVLLKLLFKRIKDLTKDEKIILPPEFGFMNDKKGFTYKNLYMLDDYSIYSYLLKWSQSEDSDTIIRDLSNRIINRNLFKSIEYSIKNSSSIFMKDNGIRNEISKKGFNNPQYYYSFDEPKDRPYSPILSPTNDEEERKSLDQNIHIKLHDSSCKEISLESKIIKTLIDDRENFVRLYVPTETLEDVTKILQN